MAFNPGELILDRVRYVTAHDLSTNEMLYMLTQIEEPSLNTAAEGEDVTDAVGARITTMYRAKTAEFTGTNSLIHLGLAAAQYGADKEVATADATITDYTYEFLDVADGETTKVLKHQPLADSLQFIYAVENGAAGTSFKVGSVASETEFVIDEESKTITVPTGFVGRLFVEYKYDSENAVRVVNSSDKFPEACSLVIYAYFKNVCNENELYLGKIVCPKAKLDPSSIELALTSTGKHPFTYQMFKDYCSDDEKLFEIIVAQ